jgi:truncated hemoglobin YjbI/CDGSH-type Zn-finger protein
MDEIIRAVRDCPSGALSYAIDGAEERAAVDHHGTRDQQIEISKDGPYRITGGIGLVDHDGADMARNQGASLEHYALCRCGHSQNKPFCSGMHYYVDFHDPVGDPDRQPTIFEWAGGSPALLRMTRLFYEKHVPQDPLLAPLFATMSADHPERVAAWLAEVFCGPKLYSSNHGGYVRMLSQHLGKCLTEEQRSRWVALLLQSAREAGLPNDPEFRSAFSSYIEWGSRLAVENSQTDAKPPQHMPMPHWDWNTAAGPPGSRISAPGERQSEEEDQPVVLPASGEPARFGDHVKTMFRRRDRRSMQFAFDLWSYDDVATHRGHPRPVAGRHHAVRRALAGRAHRSLPELGRRRQTPLIPSPRTEHTMGHLTCFGRMAWPGRRGFGLALARIVLRPVQNGRRAEVPRPASAAGWYRHAGRRSKLSRQLALPRE